MSLKKSSAWKWFALYVKERDNWTCITCGKKTKGAEMGAGHFIQAFGHASVFFNEQNVHAQCARCNGWDNTSLLRYRREIVKRYGKGADEELERLGRKTREPFMRKELLRIAKTYRVKFAIKSERKVIPNPNPRKIKL